MIDLIKIADKWQKRWEKEKIFQAKESGKKPKFYCLEMYPYPSASGLHMGHLRNYSIGDCIARFKRMHGFNVLYPMGYDSFGLPAENAAIKNNADPEEWTNRNIEAIKQHQKKIGLSYDWSRELKSHDPNYYKWNQWIFLQFYKNGLAYRKKAKANWCPGCNTVLANEQVEDGKCWRCKSEVTEKELEQWFFNITKYADELLNDINKLSQWPERVRRMQKNWIGKSQGVDIHFKLEGTDKILPTYTTRCDTIYSVTFLAIAPEHPMIKGLVQGTKQEKSVLNFVAKIKNQNLVDRENEEKEKEGIFTGKYAINPVNNEKIPVYVTNFALMYGSGIVMCDAHDKRDFKFAKKYSIPLKFVISKDGKPTYPKDEAFTEDGILFNSGKFSRMNNKEALPKIAEYLEKNNLGKRVTNYKLRDWLISRQRYWGTPIPIIYCNNCGKNNNFENYKSYLMGASNILDSELKQLNIKIIETKENSRTLIIPNKSINNYLKLIEKKLDNGFWNEVVGNKITFIFKFKDGKTKKFDLSSSTQKEIAKLCSKFNNEPYENTSDLLGYLLNNEFYADYVDKIKNKSPAIIPVPESQLPVKLPKDVKFGKGNPLETSKSFVNVKCPKCKANARRETDTMDTFVDSSWYFLRYCSPKNNKAAVDKKKVKYFAC